VIAGYSESPDGVTEATEWVNGQSIDLGPGIATAINDSGQVVGYSQNATAHLWVNGSTQDLGQWYPEGINNHGLVVGSPVTFGSAISWQQGTALQQIPDCQAALAVNDSGQIAGISMSGGNATICGQPDYMLLGAATAINNAGVAVGYSSPSAVDAVAMVFPSTQLADGSIASGINEFGWVVGQTITQGSGNVVAHFRRDAGRRIDILVAARLAGQSQPWIWSQEAGLMPLPAPLITAEGINGSRVVGAGLASDGTIHGFLLEGK
jgi:probable HAF family extracellular repeat protein